MKKAIGRPRNADLDDVVLSATVELLNQRGYAELRINDIAELSQTAKTTIYRRWPTMTHLVVDAIERVLGERSFQPTGDVVVDLDQLTESALGALANGGGSLIAIALDIHRQQDQDLKHIYRERIIEPIRQQAITFVNSAQEQGLLPSTLPPADLVDAVIGGIVHRIAILGEPMSINQAKQFWRTISRIPQDAPQ